MAGWKKLFIVLLLDYILLFGLESISPGLVMAVFNLNYLLLIILALLVYLASIPSQDKEAPLSLTSKLILSAVVGFLLIVTVFSLYKAESLQIAVYTILSFLAAGILYKVLAK